MRIAVISTPFVSVPPSGYGGTELITATLTEALIARGHDVVLYATGDSHVPGADIRHLYRTPAWPPNPIQELTHASFAVRDIAADDDVDLIHAHVASALPLAGLLDLPTVYTIHHAEDAALCDLYRSEMSSTLSLVTISARQRELLGNELAARAHVIHHGLDPSLYAPGNGGRYAAFLGRFAEEKGVHIALDAAARAGLEIRLAGAPHWKDQVYFREEIEPRLARPNVTWIGEAAHGPKVELLGGALATLFPIQWEEPFGLVMIESMLCGTPVLAFPRGSAREVIDPGITGWLVRDEAEMALRLRHLAQNWTDLDRHRCRTHAARRFSVDRMVDRYLELYAAVCGEPAESQVSTWPLS